MNICELKELFEWTTELELEIFLNMVSSKYNFDHLTLDNKSKIKQHLIDTNTDFSACLNVDPENNWVVNMLERDSGIYSEASWIKQIKKHDEYRGLSFANVSPTMYMILKPYIKYIKPGTWS